jgi:hypothetical protein
MTKNFQNILFYFSHFDNILPMKINMVVMAKKLNGVTMPIIEHLMALRKLNPHKLGI